MNQTKTMRKNSKRSLTKKNTTSSKRQLKKLPFSKKERTQLFKVIKDIKKCQTKKCKNHKPKTKEMYNCTLKKCKKQSKTLAKILKIKPLIPRT